MRSPPMSESFLAAAEARGLLSPRLEHMAGAPLPPFSLPEPPHQNMGEAPLRRGGKAGQRLHMLTAEEVVAQAAAEGLELETSRFASGYKGVTPDGARYQARVLRAGELVHLGSYVTAEEAALAVARTPEARAQVARSKAVPFTAEEVVAQAAAEGLKLETSNFASGYKGVIYKAHTDKYEARVRRAGKQVYLGCFVTPEEAALTIARACPAASPRPAALTAQEAVAQAAAEGLKLQPSNNAAGYKGSTHITGAATRPK